MPREPLWRSGLRGLLAVLCTLAIALALGAVWMAIAMSLPSASWWFVLPTGTVMGYAARAWITRSRHGATTLAILGTLLAATYMRCLYAGLQLAAVMGLGLAYTLKRAGLGMLLTLARDSLDTRMLVATLVGMAVAGLLAWFRRARRTDTTINRPAP